MSSSVCRRLRGLFTTTKTTSLPKTPNPTAAATTLNLSPAKSSGPPNDKILIALVGQFMKASRSSRFTMSSSVYRRLRGLFTTTKTTSLPKTPNPTAAAATTLNLSPAKSSGPPNDKNLIALVGQFKKASRFSRFRHNSHKAYFKIVHRLAVANKHSYIEEIVEHQKQYPDITNEGFTVRLISLYGKSGMFDHARKLFDEMPQLNCERTVMSFNALLSACVKSKKFDKISELLSELPEKLSIIPDTVSYNIVVKAFCEMGSLDSALSVVNEMEKSGVEPDLITFNTLLDALYRNDKFEEAENVWGLMQGKNVFPSGRSYNPKIRALVAGKRISEAVEVFQEMGSKGVKPDVYTFNALIKGFCDDENLEEAKRWYKEMEKNDCYPDLATLRILGNCACQEGEFEFGLELCKEAISRRCSIGLLMMQRVLDGLVKESKMEEAKELMELGKSNSFFQYKLEWHSDE